MKFFLFNLIVGIALIYLFSGEDRGLQSVSEKAYAVVDTIKSQAKAVTHVTDKREQQAPLPKTQAQIILKGPELGTAPDIMTAEIEPFKLDPVIAERRKEVMGTAVQTKIKTEIETKPNGFMSAKDRRQALMQLAEDMEYFSAESMSN